MAHHIPRTERKSTKREGRGINGNPLCDSGGRGGSPERREERNLGSFLHLPLAREKKKGVVCLPYSRRSNPAATKEKGKKKKGEGK